MKMRKMGKMGKSHQAYPDKFADQGLVESCHIPERPHPKDGFCIYEWDSEKREHVQLWYNSKTGKTEKLD